MAGEKCVTSLTRAVAPYVSQASESDIQRERERERRGDAAKERYINRN